MTVAFNQEIVFMGKECLDKGCVCY